ncbi:substrate-binding domain-containing protein [Syntrophomonas curvata]
MDEKKALSTQQVADILHVSNSTIYNLVKSGQLRAYKVGRKMRFTEHDINDYIAQAQENQSQFLNTMMQRPVSDPNAKPNGFVLCGQDMILDVLSNHMRHQGIPALRAYIGSYDSLISLYRDEVNVASAHLWESDSDTYNIPYVRRLLPGIATVIIHMTTRIQGLYVAKGNPKNITGWKDFGRSDITMVNREEGAGSRVLLDEHLRLLGIYGSSIKGYKNQIQSHFSVASAVSRGDADVAIGTEKIARQVENIDFIPLQKESYDLVIRKEYMQSHEIMTMLSIIRSKTFQTEFASLGYDITDMGKIIA